MGLIAWRAFAVWLVIIAAETVHGILRTILLAPYVGDFQARQISVFTGSFLILGIACLFVRWIRAGSNEALLGIGVGWVVLTVLFEFGLGHFVLGQSWDRLSSDYKIWQGGLIPLGLVALALAPIVAARLRLSAST